MYSSIDDSKAKNSEKEEESFTVRSYGFRTLKAGLTKRVRDIIHIQIQAGENSESIWTGFMFLSEFFRMLAAFHQNKKTIVHLFFTTMCQWIGREPVTHHDTPLISCGTSRDGWPTAFLVS